MSSRIDDILAIDDPTEFAIALSDHVFGRPGGEGLAGLTEAEQTVFCIAGLERDVNNGGFAQFFSNSAGGYARETIEALRRIGAQHTAGLLEQAVAPFGAAGPAQDEQERGQQLRHVAKSAAPVWRELDGTFCEYQDDLTGLLRAYARSARDQFPS